jgi:polyphosphate glucokinase
VVTPKKGQPATLAIDVGGTGLKASVLDTAGKLITDRVRVRTKYPCPPERLVDTLARLVAPLPTVERVSISFPGVVRKGVVLTAPDFVTRSGPGSAEANRLVAAWTGFDLAGAMATRLGHPVRVANDADIQGLEVVSGSGVEFVVTLGTGVGTALLVDGRLSPHSSSRITRFGKARHMTSSSATQRLRTLAPGNGESAFTRQSLTSTC